MGGGDDTPLSAALDGLYYSMMERSWPGAPFLVKIWGLLGLFLDMG